jgi:hypothetical protein
MLAAVGASAEYVFKAQAALATTKVSFRIAPDTFIYSVC